MVLGLLVTICYAVAYALYGSLGDALAWVRAIDVETLRAAILGFGVWAPLASIGLMVVHTFVPFPLELLAMSNGLIFGVWDAILLTWVGMVLGSWAGYGAARLVRPLVVPLVPGDSLARLERRAAGGSGMKLAAVRLVPVFSFNLLNLGFGLLRVPLWRFTWTTAVGIVPNVVVAVLAGQFLTVGPWSWVAVGVSVAALGAYYLARKRRGRSERR